jgi:predicted nucleotidyltransferase
MSKGLRQLQRLDEIAVALQKRPDVQALIGLGSTGRDLERLDEYSDLDFFVIVEPGSKPAYLRNLDWLSEVHPVAFSFQNTVDGFKLLFADGIFCELAVFEPQELPEIPYEPGRIIWKRPEVPESLSQPRKAANASGEPDLEWLLGEALTNLYIGLSRFRRGEKLSAARFIQGYAVDRVLQLISLIEPPAQAKADPFTTERRFEQRYPHYAAWLDRFIQGYAASPQSAQAILEFLKQHFSINPALEKAIVALYRET